MFTPEKVAQIAAYFVAKESCPINVMKLVKLMYLADRESMFRYGHPISYDTMVSMQNGPVLSQTYRLIQGESTQPNQQVWNRWIAPRVDHVIQLVNTDFDEKDLNHLSKANLIVLSSVWNEFGNLSQWQLSDYTHENCSEWSKPKNMESQSTPINDVDIFRALGIEEGEAIALAEEVQHGRNLEAIFAPS